MRRFPLFLVFAALGFTGCGPASAPVIGSAQKAGSCTLQLVTAPDGHDYIVLTGNGTSTSGSITHAAGCKACAKK